MAVLSSAVLLVLLAQPWQADAVRSPWDLGKLVLTMTAQSHEGNQASASAVLTPAPVTVPFDKKLQVGFSLIQQLGGGKHAQGSNSCRNPAAVQCRCG